MSYSKVQHIELDTIDSSHNHECFNYLKKLKLFSRLIEALPEELEEIAKLNDYNPKITYGNMYTNFFNCIHEKQVIDKINLDLNLAKARLEVQEDIKNQIPPTQKGFMKLFHHQLEQRIKRLEDEKSTLEEEGLDASFLFK
jgi:hypothetical protein